MSQNGRRSGYQQRSDTSSRLLTPILLCRLAAKPRFLIGHALVTPWATRGQGWPRGWPLSRAAPGHLRSPYSAAAVPGHGSAGARNVAAGGADRGLTGTAL